MATRQSGRGSAQGTDDPLGQFSREEEKLMEIRARAGADQDEAARQAEQSRWATPAQGSPVYDGEDKRGMYEDAVAPGQEYGHVSAGAHGGAPEPADLKKREDEGDEGEEKGKAKPDDEQDKVDSKLGRGYTGDEDEDAARKGKFHLGRKKGGVGILLSLLVSLVFGGASILHGPLEFIHASQLFQKLHFGISNNTSDGRVGKLIKYARTRNDPNRRNLGWKGNTIADYFEKKMANAGIIADYFDSNGKKTGSIQRFKIDTNTEEGKIALKKIEALDIDTGKITRTADNIVELDISDLGGTKGTKATRAILKGSIDAMGFGNVSEAMAKRVLRFRAGVSFHQLRNRFYDKGDDLLAYIRGVFKDRDAVIQDGVKETDLNGTTTGEDPPQDATPEQQAAANQADELAAETNDIVKAPEVVGEAGIRELADSLKGKLTKGLGFAAVVGFMCAVKGFGDSFGPYLRTNVLEPMIRMAMMTISIGNQVMSNKDVNAQELGVYSKNFVDATSKLSWTAADSVQHEIGHNGTGNDIPSSLKPGRDKPAFFLYLDMVPGLGPTCNAMGSKLGSIALTTAGVIASGGLSAITDYLTGLATAKAADSLHLFENLARLIFKGGVSPDAAGPLFGNIVNYGTRLADNDAAIAKGGVELSNSQVAVLEQENRQWFAAQQSQKSLYARYVDPYDINSLVGSAILTMPRDPTQAAMAFIKAPLQSIGNMFRPAGAQSTDQPYDYGFSKYGFSLDDQESPIVSDPYANADAVEPRLAELNQKYGNCFSTTVDPQTGNIITKDVALYKEIPDMCRDSSNEELVRYRFYLLDQFTANAMTCYAGDEDACENGRGNSAPAAPPASTGGGSGMIVGDPYTDSTTVPCAPGTTFVRVDTGYSNHVPFQVNLCSLSNLFEYDTPALVNSRVSGAWYKLVNDANVAGAAAGWSLSAISSFRTNDEQIVLWNRYGQDPNRVASPGGSSHQAGVAIDFANMSSDIGGQTCDTRATANTPEYAWLVANAAKYGLHQYSAEAWHWDALPASNRC